MNQRHFGVLAMGTKILSNAWQRFQVWLGAADSGRRYVAELFALSAFALAQPVLAILGDNPEFFIFRRSTPSDVILLLAFFSLALPLALCVLVLSVRLVSRKLAALLHSVVIGVLSYWVLMPMLARLDEVLGLVLIVLGLLGAGGIGYLRTRSAGLRLFFTALLPGVLIFPVWFLIRTPVFQMTTVLQKVEHTQLPGPRAPVVFLVLDEMNTLALMKPDLSIDRRRFPNFARLADSAHWFRNMTASGGLTELAVPSLLSGVLPKHGLATLANYPGNLFTWLGHSYRLHAVEAATRLCPTSLCPKLVRSEVAGKEDVWEKAPQPNVAASSLIPDALIVSFFTTLPKDVVRESQTLSGIWNQIYLFTRVDSGRPRKNRKGPPRASNARYEQYSGFLANISGEPGRLYYLHLLLPHIPYQYLPSGKLYNTEFIMPGWNPATEMWTQDELIVRQAHRRYLLQTQFTDALIGQLIERMQRVGIWEKSYVVVVADHGTSFQAGRSRRRLPDAELAEIAMVPLFIKLPHQKAGVLHEQPAQSVDVLPTLAGAMGSRLPWKADGCDLLGAKCDRSRIRTIGELPVELEMNRVKELLVRQQEVFGQGLSSKSMFEIGPAAEIVGRSPSTYLVGRAGFRYSLRQAEHLAVVDKTDEFVPAYIMGSVVPAAGTRLPMDLAIAVNGTIRTTTRTFAELGSPASFASLVPESSLVNGRNRVEVYAIVREQGRVRLFAPAP